MTPKDEMIQRIERSWDVLVQTFENVSDEALSTPGEDGGWAAKDHLAHIGAWEGKMLAILQDRPVPDGLGIDPETYEREDVDGINAAIFERTRDLPVEDVVERLRTTHGQLMAALANAGEDALERPFVPEDTTETRRVADGVVENTYQHYDEHLPELQQLLGSR